MRRKGRLGKTKKILIRVDAIDKELAEELSHRIGKNTSEFFRDLLHEYNENKQLELHLKITENNKQLASYLKTTISALKKKNKG